MAERASLLAGPEIRSGSMIRSFVLRCALVSAVCLVAGWFDDRIGVAVAVAVTAVVVTLEWQHRVLGRGEDPRHDAARGEAATPNQSVEQQRSGSEEPRVPESDGESRVLVRRFRDDEIVLTLVREEMVAIPSHEVRLEATDIATPALQTVESWDVERHGDG